MTRSLRTLATPSAADLELGQALADVASVALVWDRTTTDQFRRLYARERNERLSEVARQLVTREITAASVLTHARDKSVRKPS